MNRLFEVLLIVLGMISFGAVLATLAIMIREAIYNFKEPK